MLAYSSLAHLEYDLDVLATVILLCREADSPSLTGLYLTGNTRFEYQVIRLWELSPDVFFNGKPSLLPLAPLSNVTEAEIPNLIRRMVGAIATAFDAATQKKLWTSTHVLMGLRLKPAICNQLMEGVFNMLDLSTSNNISTDSGGR